MFKFLKEKLKSWIGKTEEPAEKQAKARPEKPAKKKEKIPEKKTCLVNAEEIVREIKQEPETEKTKFFDKFKKKMTDEKFEEIFSELELILLQNNVALEAVKSIKSSLAEQLIGKPAPDINVKEALKNSIESILISPPDFVKEIKSTLKIKHPFVIAFVGINGSGKTTSAAKIAHLLKKNNLSVLLAAADTFRAASIEQLEEHASKLNIPIVKKDYGSDPASVGFDAIQHAKKHHIDVVLIDTAGRMQNKDSLMKEIEKITRVNNPDMKIFVGESITGNDATQQAKAFDDAVNITGMILSKADVDEKGGTAISVSYVTKKPILFLGTGQSYGDLKVFNRNDLIKSLGLD